MADIKSPEERSANMAAIKSKDTKPEVFLRKLLFSAGYRYRKNYKNIPGHPDIYLAKYHTAIFMNGCFWHRHSGCKYAYVPKTRQEYWLTKFKQNKERDQLVRKELEESGIRQLIIWECTIRNMKKTADDQNVLLKEIEAFFKSNTQYLEI